jgi:OPA family glycerol-3-phosphate transporter-like MFS transporter
MPAWLENLAPIVILLAVVAFVIARLPKVEGLPHTPAFRRRRILNWLPLGLTYAFLYMGRYNLKVSQLSFGDMPDAAGAPLMGNDDFGWIFAAGTVTYGVSFLLNGPLTDRFGGTKAILVGAGGSALSNALIGLATWALVARVGPWEAIGEHLTALLIVLYAVNMYFQSFGAVAVVKVNAPWFHLRERGVFGAIFGVLISLGVYFAYDWGKLILDNFGLLWVFFVPAILLALCIVAVIAWVKDSPAQAGQKDFDTADASSGDDGPRLPVIEVFKKMFSNPVILTIAAVEFCSGFLRQAIMQWFREFAKQTDAALGLSGSFVYDNWGVLLCCAGILGGVVAGVISDRVFDSRRGPVATILYLFMLLGAVVLLFTYTSPIVGWMVVAMSMAVIGVHGMLSGTASMDFGGRKNVGTAVGIIDGFVYLGTAVMSLTYGLVLPDDPAIAADPENWVWWPGAMIPVALLGTLLATRVWNAKPQPKKAVITPAAAAASNDGPSTS